jgi:hypothetical protein
MIFRFVARFVFPILNITRMAQDRLHQMQKQMEDMQQQQQQKPSSRPANQVEEGEYIEYEEVK